MIPNVLTISKVGSCRYARQGSGAHLEVTIRLRLRRRDDDTKPPPQEGSMSAPAMSSTHGLPGTSGRRHRSEIGLIAPIKNQPALRLAQPTPGSPRLAVSQGVVAALRHNGALGTQRRCS